MSRWSGRLRFERVLVTGAEGFVGSRLVPRLVASLRPDSRMLACVRGGAGPDQVDLDLLDADAVEALIAAYRPDLVVNLAAQSSVGDSAAAAAATWDINCGAVVTLGRAMAAVPRASFLQISSAEVYGATFNAGAVAEHDPLRPLTAYARSKAAAEAALADVLPSDAGLVIVRPANHSGPGQDTRFVLPTLARQIALIEAGRAEPILSVGNLDAERDFIHVDDVVDTYLRLLAVAEGRHVVNVGSGVSVPVTALLERLVARTKAAMTVRQDPARLRPSDIPRAALDVDRLRALTGWVPPHDLDRLVASVLDDQRAAVAAEVIGSTP